MNRKQARDCAFKILFSKEFSCDSTATELFEKEIAEGNYDSDNYVKAVLCAIDANKEEIEQAIQTYAVGWKLNRVSAVSRAILKLAIAELFYFPEIRGLVSLNEAIELVKKYDDEAAKNFVNGILDAVSKEARITRNEE